MFGKGFGHFPTSYCAKEFARVADFGLQGDCCIHEFVDDTLDTFFVLGRVEGRYDEYGRVIEEEWLPENQKYRGDKQAENVV